MKRLLTASLLTLLAVPQAFAADTRLELPLRDLIDSPQAKAAGIDGSVRFFLAGEKTPAVVMRMGEDVTNKKTNGVGKSDVESCNWVALSALKALQEGAKDRGANAVINITSYFKKNEFRSATNYECYAGNIMSGVALKGTYVTVK
ncbi:excinuclease ATPase subunit [Pseudoxanthomonas sp. PXM03]|uniref:excinuclease ATPase subunit n=1 Tax=Pseudoxanthomonas sp. PXM03 TaxID=2769284 RepID=UPI00177D1BE5|nr:excinuclease ATPase subunit [Pseudoxanthomonas sp. PXM03]MBD9437356.1 excinuclease ATPase subunit [Pseudoxanthomonas sp. PXM03]